MERSDLPVGQQSEDPITDELISRFDNAQTLARLVHARAGLVGWDLAVACTRDALEAVAPVLVAAEVARVRAQTAEDLRATVEKAIKDWAVLYPIPANGLAGGDPRAEERLAANWASSATRRVFEALDEHAGKASDSSPAALRGVVGTPDRVWWYHEPCFWSSGPFLASEPRPRRCAGCFSDAGDWLQLVPVRPPISAAEGGGEADLSNVMPPSADQGMSG